MFLSKIIFVLAITYINSNNLFVNPGFQADPIPNNFSQVYPHLTGWECYPFCQIFCCRTCDDKCVNLEIAVSQHVNIEQRGKYRLIVNYYPPALNTIYRTLRVFLNGSQVTQVTTNQERNISDPKFINITLNLQKGLYKIQIYNDQYGLHGFNLIGLQMTRLTMDSKNLIVNYDFLGNYVPNADYWFYSNLEGWECQPNCELNCCNFLANQYKCSEHCVDLDPNGYYTSLTQNINSQTGGQCNLIIKYYDPMFNNANRTFRIHLNKRIIHQFWSIQSMNISNMKMLKLSVMIEKGINNLTLSMDGAAPNSMGFTISKVQLFYVETLDEKLKAYIEVFDNNLFQNSMSAPGFRVIFSHFGVWIANFDRFQLYNYHNRTYSQNMLAFLKKVQEIQQLQLILLKNIGMSISQSIAKYFDSLKIGFSFKKDHLNSIEVPLVQQRIGQFKDGFMQNQLDFLIYKVAACCVIFVILKIIFHILFNYPVSIMFRKYYFFGTLALLILDGSIQELIFFLSLEMKLLISFSFHQKIINWFIIFIMFIVIILSISLFLFFYIQYKKLTKYLQENSRPILAGILASTMDRGIMCMLLGFAHRLLIEQPNTQLFVLAFIQSTWIFLRLKLNKIDSYILRYLVLIWNIQNCLRIFMILSFYLYNQYLPLRLLIGQLHADLIISYIFLMIIEFSINSVLILKETCSTIQQIYSYSSTKKPENKINISDNKKHKKNNIQKKEDLDMNHNNQTTNIRHHQKTQIHPHHKKKMTKNPSLNVESADYFKRFQKNTQNSFFSVLNNQISEIKVSSAINQSSLKNNNKQIFQRHIIQDRRPEKSEQKNNSIINFQRNKRKLKACWIKKQGQLVIIHDKKANFQ